MRLLAASALILIALVFAWTWAYGDPYSDDACLNAEPPERSAYSTEPSLWPPGGKCVIELPAGGERIATGPVPWFEWTFLALCAAAVVGVAAAWRRLSARVHSRARPE